MGQVPIVRHYATAAETWTRERLEEYQLGRLRWRLRRTFDGNEFFRDHFERAGLTASRIDGLESLKEFRELVPTMTKADVVADQNDFPPWGRRVGVPREAVYQVMLTSGTSGMGRELYAFTRSDWELYSTYVGTSLAWSGVTPGGLLVDMLPAGFILGGHGGVFPAERLGLTVLMLGLVPDTESKVDYLQSFGSDITVLYNPTPTFLVRETAVLESRGATPREVLPNLQAVFLAGEPYPAEWVTRMLELWIAPFLEIYSSTSGVFACTCENGPVRAGARQIMHALEHLCLIEVLDESGEHVAPGERGEIVVTNLAKEASQVIRFRTGDIGTFLPHDSCDCLRPFNGVEAGTIGRKDDMIKVRGMNVWPAAVDEIILGSDVCIDYVGLVELDHNGKEQIRLSVALDDAAVKDKDPDVITSTLEARLRSNLGVDMSVSRVDRESLPTYEFKARRWTDRRQEQLKELADR